MTISLGCSLVLVAVFCLSFLQRRKGMPSAIYWSGFVRYRVVPLRICLTVFVLLDLAGRFCNPPALLLGLILLCGPTSFVVATHRTFPFRTLLSMAGTPLVDFYFCLDW
jgi:hypothetical protein